MNRRTDADAAPVGHEAAADGTSPSEPTRRTTFSSLRVPAYRVLFFAGGASNPFAIFYFVNLALAAVILPTRWGWTLTIIAIVCMVGIMFRSQPLSGLMVKPVSYTHLRAHET